MPLHERAHVILDEIRDLVGRVSAESAGMLYETLINAPRVSAYATGRTGYILRTFVMRLNHLGHEAYYVGEASTPPVRAGDVFLVASGSGSTATTLGAAMEANRLGASVVAICGSRLSPLGQLANPLVELPAPHKRGVSMQDSTPSQQTLGSLFEQGCFILLESYILRLVQEQGSQEAALERHANLEA